MCRQATLASEGQMTIICVPVFDRGARAVIDFPKATTEDRVSSCLVLCPGIVRTIWSCGFRWALRCGQEMRRVAAI